ncbi:MAG: sulfotransferase family 2 domain-containing protein [Porticoccaceae bacterium]
MSNPVNVKKTSSFARIIFSNYRKNLRKNRANLFYGFSDVVKAARGRILDPAEYFVCEDKKLAYLVNSKVACSSIKSALISHNGYGTSPVNYIEVHKTAAEMGMSQQHLNMSQLSGLFTFTFVRDPFARLVSLYVNKFSRREIFYNGFHFEHYLGGIIDQSFTFEQFVKVVSKIPDRMSDRHFKAQAFLIYDESPKIDYIGKMENLGNDYLNISKKYGLGDLPHINKSKKINIAKYYDKKLLNIVGARYERDIELFGYASSYNAILKEI